MSIFLESILLLRTAERRLIGAPNPQQDLFDAAMGRGWYPLKYLMLGIGEKTKGPSVWAFLAFCALIPGTWLITYSGIARTEVANIVLWACAIFPLLIVLFALPSSYCHTGVSADDVSFVVKHLTARKLFDSRDIELIKKSVKLLEDRARSRLTVLKWLVGLIWAWLAYTYTKSLDGSLTLTVSQMIFYGSMVAALVVAVTFAYLLVWGYEASLDKTFRLIEFGCNDHVSDFQRRESRV